MCEIFNYSFLNPLTVLFSFLVLGGIFSFIGGAVKSVVKAATGLTGGVTVGAKVTESKSSADAAALARKKLQLARAKGKLDVETEKAKNLRNILMIGGVIVLIVFVFFMAKGGRR